MTRGIDLDITTPDKKTLSSRGTVLGAVAIYRNMVPHPGDCRAAFSAFTPLPVTVFQIMPYKKHIQPY